MVLCENWAVKSDRICDFFHNQDDVSGSEGMFFYKSCRITLTSLPPQSGIFSVSRTELQIDGPDDEVHEIHHRFFLRFLSAGG